MLDQSPNMNDELYDAIWRPAPEGRFPAPVVPVAATASGKPAPIPQPGMLLRHIDYIHETCNYYSKESTSDLGFIFLYSMSVNVNCSLIIIKGTVDNIEKHALGR